MKFRLTLCASETGSFDFHKSWPKSITWVMRIILSKFKLKMLILACSTYYTYMQVSWTHVLCAKKLWILFSTWLTLSFHFVNLTKGSLTTLRGGPHTGWPARIWAQDRALGPNRPRTGGCQNGLGTRLSDLVAVCPLPEIYIFLMFSVLSYRCSIPTFRLSVWTEWMRIWDAR